MNILVAEDEPAVGQLIKEILSPEHVVFLAETPDSAVAIATQHEFHLVILDSAMGADRVCSLCPHAKVLQISGHGEGYLRDGGMTGAFLHKPFNPAQLLAKVREVLQNGAQDELRPRW
jgi:DNA-binding response OmpR family regulator